MARRNRIVVEPLINPPELDGVLRLQSDAVETYDQKQMEARRQEENTNLPTEAEGRPPGETAVAETVMECGTIDVGRPVRIRRQPVRFGIDEYVS